MSGASCGPPDFIGVGAQRAGTSWWFSLLLRHPGIEGPLDGDKELHFFDEHYGRGFGPNAVAAYHSKFGPPGGGLRGEWTPGYMYDFWTPRLLAEAAPEARLLVLLRDPVERFHSGFEHESMLYGYHSLRGKVNAGTALERGMYHRQLTRLLEYFPRPQVLVLQYEQCAAEPTQPYRRTLEFLGAGDEFDPGEAAMRETVGNELRKLTLPERLRAMLQAELREDVAQLGEEFPEIDLGLWPNFAELAGSGA